MPDKKDASEGKRGELPIKFAGTVSRQGEGQYSIQIPRKLNQQIKGIHGMEVKIIIDKLDL